MIRIGLTIAITVITMDTVTAQDAPKIPMESDVQLVQVTSAQAHALAQLVRLYGYRCDTISAAQPFIWGEGYKLHCNNWRYLYEVEDRGGRWVVTVD